MKEVMQKLGWVDEYIREQEAEPKADKLKVFQTLYAHISKFKDLSRLDLTVLEVGCGTGWLCRYFEEHGIHYQGIEIIHQLADYGLSQGNNVALANAETFKTGKYDIVVCCSSLEHIQDWKATLKNIYTLLKEGGILYISTTNAIGLFSGEYPKLPFYGLLPNRVRYWLMRRKYGNDIMQSGVDYNQFTYGDLKSYLKALGFEVHDASEIYDKITLNSPTFKKHIVLALLKRRIFRSLLVRIMPNNVFICTKGR